MQLNFGSPAPDMDQPLPKFRRDLETYPGPDDIDGSPTFKVFDPIKTQFFRVTWAEATIMRLMKPNITINQLLKRINHKTSLRVTAEELIYFFEDAGKNGLTEKPRSGKSVDEELIKRKNIPFRKRLIGLIFLRIPLINPDKFLDRTLPYWNIITSKLAFFIYISLSLIGTSLLFSRFGEFIHTFTFLFNFKGIAYYFFAIAGVKIIHEFSHAYTAKRYGVHVPKMGIMMIVTMPLLYTDVTDSWKLPSRFQRFAISVAGVTAELIIAGLSTFGWVMVEPGFLQSIFFVLASTSWLSTLLVNINPAMQFDGYYILSDLSGIENLRPRAFAMARWKIRHLLFKLEMPCPEPDATKKRIVGMTIYSIYAWIYRMLLYIGIGTMIYFLFTKFLAIIFFTVQIINMMLAPIFGELLTIWKLRSKIKMNLRIVSTFTVLGLLLVWFIVPLPHQETFSGIITPKDNQTLYVPSSGKVEEVFVERNQKVSRGTPIIKIFSQQLDNEIRQTELQKKIYETEIKILREDEERGQSLVAEKKSALSTINESLNTLLERQNQNLVTASFSGTVYAFDELLEVGQFVFQNQVIGEVN